MRLTWAYVRGVLRNEYAIGASPDVGRVFLVCRECRRVVPVWRAMAPTKTRPSGCPCGGLEIHARNIPEWRAWLWLFWGLLRRQDPRMAIRSRDL